MANLGRGLLDTTAGRVAGERTTDGRAAGNRPGGHGPAGEREPCEGFEPPRRLISNLRASLTRTIESEVVPRLMLAHQPAAPELANRRRILSDDIVEMARLAVAHDAEVSVQFVESLLAQGVTLDTVYLQLLTGAARHLGEMWEADRCSFTDVTIGLWRLHGVLREMGLPGRDEAQVPRQPTRRILLSAMPGEQHSFGTTIVCEFFRRAGWDVLPGPFVSGTDLAGTVKRQSLDVVGLSISGDRQLPALTELVRAVRATSRNPRLKILVGGRVFSEHPHLVATVGADATAPDAEQAVKLAEQLVGQRDLR